MSIPADAEGNGLWAGLLGDRPVGLGLLYLLRRRRLRFALVVWS